MEDKNKVVPLDDMPSNLSGKVVDESDLPTSISSPKPPAPSTKGGESGAVKTPSTSTSVLEDLESGSWTKTISPNKQEQPISKPVIEVPKSVKQVEEVKQKEITPVQPIVKKADFVKKVAPNSFSPEVLKNRVNSLEDMYKRAIDRGEQYVSQLSVIDNELKKKKAYLDSNPNDAAAIDDFNISVQRRNELADLTQKEQIRSKLIQKRIEESQGEIDTKLGSLESMSNSLSNVVTQIKSSVPKMNLSMTQLQKKITDGVFYAYGKMYGMTDEEASIVSKQASKAMPASFIAGGMSAEKSLAQSYKQLSEFEKEQKPTKSIIKTFKEGDIQGLAAAIFDGGTSVLATMVTSAPTGGVSMYPEMVGDAIYNYNKTKAKRLGVSVEKLYEENLDEIAVPSIIGAISASLEKIGLEGISKAINKKIGSKAVKDIFEIVLEGSKEAGTEWLQTGLEEYNKALAEGLSVDLAGEVALSKMTSEEGLEAALKGAAGSGVSIATGRAAKAIWSAASNKKKQELKPDLDKIETLVREKESGVVGGDALGIIDNEINNTTAKIQQEVLKDAKQRINLTDENSNLVSKIESDIKLLDDEISSKKSLIENPNISEETKSLLKADVLNLEAKKIDLDAQSEEIIKNNRPIELTKNTSPTSDKYGTINRNDGKGVVDLTKEEFEAEQAKMQPKVDEQVAPTAEQPKTEEEKPLATQEVMSNEKLLANLPSESEASRVFEDRGTLKNAPVTITVIDRYGNKNRETRYIPWSIHEKANKNDTLGGQTAREIAQRGGYSDSELDEKYPNWRKELAELSTPTAEGEQAPKTKEEIVADVELKNEGKAEAPTKESVTERLNINNPFYQKVEDALVKLGLIEKYNPETGTGDVVGGYAQQTSDGGFSAGKMLFSQDGSISYFDGDVKVSFDKNGNVISENTKEVAEQNKQNEIESKKENIANLEKTRDSEAFKYKEVTETDPLGNRKKVKRLKTEQELKESTDKINAAIDKAKNELTELEKQYEKEPTKKEDGEPMSGGVQGLRPEGQAGKESAELRPEEEEVADPLKDVESTTAALGNAYYEQQKYDEYYEIKKIAGLEDSTVITDISEAYHKAKADGSNPQLVEAVEQLLGKPKESTPQEGSVVGGEVEEIKNKDWFHGSENEFNTFENKNPNITGFWFSDSKENAMTYGNKVKQVSLDIKNPLVIDAKGKKFTDDIEVEVLAKYPNEEPYITKIGLDIDEIVWMAKNGKRKNSFIELVNSGYDAVVFKNIIDPSLSSRSETPQTSIAVFDNNQIKPKAVEQSLQAPKAEEKVSGGLTQEEKANLENISKDAGVNFQEVRNVYNKYGEGKPLNEITLEDYQKAEEKRQGGKEKEQELPLDQKGRKVGSTEYKAGRGHKIGRTITRTAPDGTKIKGTFKLVSAKDLLPSHNPVTFSKNENFPQTKDGKTINDRDYETDKLAQAQVVDIAQNLDGAAVTQMPTVSKEGIVYDGNNRTMSRQLAAKNKTDQEYLDALKEQAEMYGFTEEQVNEVENPMLVFEVEENLPFDTETMAKFNKPEKKAQSPVQRAVAISKRITDRAKRQLALLYEQVEVPSDVTSNPKMMKEAMDILVSEGLVQTLEMPRFVDKGVATPDGVSLLEGIVMAASLNEDAIVALSVQGMGDVKTMIIKNIVGLMQNSTKGADSLIPDIAGAINIVQKAKAGKILVKDYLSQYDVFSENSYTLGEMCMALLLDTKKPTELKKFLANYNQDVGVENLFDEDTSKQAILDRTLLNIISDYEKIKKNLEGIAAERKEPIEGGAEKPQPTTKSSEEVETPKQEKDAVQKQAAGQVPIQPKAGVSEEVEGGKPETKSEKATKESQKEIDELFDLYESIDESKGLDKRKAADDFRNMQQSIKNPTLKRIFDNISDIHSQLEKQGLITKTKGCP